MTPGLGDQHIQNFYQILSISETATAAEIKSAYHGLAIKFHPDKTSEPGANEKFRTILQAYKVLSDPIMRANHDCFVCIPHTPPQKQQCRFNNTNANNPHPQQSPNFHYANANQRDPGFFCPSDAKREKEAAERLKKDKETEEHFIIEKIKRDKFYSFFDQNPRCTEPTIMQCTKQAQQQVHSQRLDSLDEKKRRETNRQLILRTVAKTLWIPQNCYKRLVKIIRRRVRREKIRF